MDNTSAAHPTQTPPRWPLLLTWMLCLLALLHVLLLFSVTNSVDRNATMIRLLQPIATAGAIVVLLMATFHEQDRRRRRCWAIHSASMLVIIGASVLNMVERASGSYATPAANEWLYPLMYGLSLLGAAYYFPWRTLLTGSALRIVLDSAAVTIATLVLLQSALPFVLTTWPWPEQTLAALLYPALNIGMLFAFGMIATRLGQHGGPLLPLVLLSLACLLIADSIFIALAWLPGGYRWHLAEGRCMCCKASCWRWQPTAACSIRRSLLPLIFAACQPLSGGCGRWCRARSCLQRLPPCC